VGAQRSEVAGAGALPKAKRGSCCGFRVAGFGAGGGSLLTITGRMNSGVSLAGRKK